MLNNILDAIGNTPLVKVNHFNAGPCDLYLKLENQNPGGSIKDRIALYMINDAEEKGILKPGGEIIEATAGNTGLGLALVAGIKGYKLTLVIPDKMSQEKIHHLKAMGVEIVVTRSDVGKGHPEYYQDLAEKMATERGAYFINQFRNKANPLAHYKTTGPEIWHQTDQKVDAIVLGVGSSGTLAGLTRFFKETKPDMEFVLADPEGSILADYVNKGEIPKEVGSWYVEGIGEDFIPEIADFSMTRQAYSISDRESFETARQLLIKEGIFAGSSSGTLLAAALKYCQAQQSAKNVVTFACDSGNKYLTKMFNDLWMKDHGLINRVKYGNLRDLIFRRRENNEIVILSPEDTIQTTYLKMKKNDISQLPVLQDDEVVGLVDESDLLLAISSNLNNFNVKVGDIMSKNIVTIAPQATESALLDILKRDYVAVVQSEEGYFYGMITKIDYLTYLNLQKQVL
ncbi:MAG: pyridoxal-phosphate dependent enzyme [Candidatus Cyclobacteriaceae bacterium M3_2C_046]